MIKDIYVCIILTHAAHDSFYEDADSHIGIQKLYTCNGSMKTFLYQPKWQ